VSDGRARVGGEDTLSVSRGGTCRRTCTDTRSVSMEIFDLLWGRVFRGPKNKHAFFGPAYRVFSVRGPFLVRFYLGENKPRLMPPTF